MTLTIPFIRASLLITICAPIKATFPLHSITNYSQRHSMVNMIITAVLLIVAGVTNGGMDVLQFNPRAFVFQSDWWLTKGEFAWNKRPWYTKYIFTMVSDGWHFLKFLNIMAYITAIVIQTTNDIRLIITILVCVFVAYTIVGLSFEYGYKFLWRK